MTKLLTSDEFDVENYETFIHEQGYDVFYMNDYSDHFNQSGFQVSLSSPGYNALLSKDVWIEYQIAIAEIQGFGLAQTLENPGQDLDPQDDDRLAFRGGNIIARSIEDLRVSINGIFTETYQPALYMDVTNRLYVSPKQSKQEFSASGGIFDSGNHGNRIDSIRYEEQIDDAEILQAQFQALYPERTRLMFAVIPKFHSGQDITGDIPGPPPNLPLNLNSLASNMRPPYPLIEQFYNPGFSQRYDNFVNNLRLTWVPLVDQRSNQIAGLQFAGGNDPEIIAPGGWWKLSIFERIPCPLFKMYSTDGTFGVIPHIQKLTITARFLTRIFENMFRSDQDADNKIYIVWQFATSKDCIVHSKWFIPKRPLPAMIHFNLPKYITIPNTLEIEAPATLNDVGYYDTTFKINPVSLPAIPDILLVYIKYDPHDYYLTTPDDCQLEIRDFYFVHNKSNSKCMGIQSIQMYQNWKENLKYQSEELTTFEEWYKYIAVCILRPEDYGIKTIGELNEPCEYAFRGTARNWHINPSIWDTDVEDLGGQAGNGTSYLFIVHAIYFRNELTLSPEKSMQNLQEFKIK